MSWQSYIDDHLQVEIPGTGGFLRSSAIVGHDGGLWAQSPEFPAITGEEVAKIMSGFTDNKAMGASGIFIGGVKFQQVYADDSVIRGATKIDEKKAGCCIKKTNTAIVIGIYVDPIPVAACNSIIENMGDYLSGQGY
jgi:profilin